MKKTLSKAAVVILAASLGVLSLTATAGQDENQRYQIQQFIKAKQQAQAAEAAKQEAMADQCRKMMEQSKDANGS